MAELKTNTGKSTPIKPTSSRTPITTADFGRAVWQRYQAALMADEAKRDQYATKAEITAARDRLDQRAKASEIAFDPLAALDASLDLLRNREVPAVDQFARNARLAALRSELSDGETHQVEHEIDAHLEHHGLSADEGTAERRVLARQLMRAEIEALERTMERDRGTIPASPVTR